MKPDAKLFELVKKLSPSEKRYYSLMRAKEEAGKSNLLLLFEALCALHERGETYDEEWIHSYLRATGEHTVSRTIADVKNDLYASILKMMRSYHSRRNVDSMLREMLEDVGFLLSKGLYNHAEESLKRARTVAEKYEQTVGLLEVMRLERRLLYDRTDTQLVEKIARHIGNEERALQHLQMEYTLQHIYDRMFSQLRLQFTGHEVDNSALEALLAHPVFAHEKAEYTFAARCWYYRTMSLYYRMRQEHATALVYEKEGIEWWQQHSEQLHNAPQAFMRELANYIGLCIRLGQRREFAEAMHYWKTIPCRTADDEAERFQNEVFLQLLYAMNTDALLVVQQETKPVLVGLQKFEGRINPARVLAICYNYTAVFFLLGMHAKALEWCNELLDRKKYTVRVDLLVVAHLMDPLIHYELGNAELVDNRCRAATRFIQKHRELYAYEREFLLLIKKLPDLIEKEKRTQRVRAMQQQMQEEAAPDALVQELLLWLESIATGTPLRELFLAQQSEKKA